MKLQNNFTTPEQSRRLLELGLPKGSADLWYRCYGEYGKPLINNVVYSDMPEVGKNITTGDIPCWSVGRLIEVITLCCSHYSGNNDIVLNRAAVDFGIIECLIAYLSVEKKDISVDFSKLEG